jgi:hypothetical protein
MKRALILFAVACAHPGGAGLENDPHRLPETPLPEGSIWNAFARKGATWELGGYEPLTVKVMDVRVEKGQHIATLRWTLSGENIPYVQFNEIVWGPGGAWLTTQDTHLDELLTKPPTVTDPVQEDPAREHFVRWENTAKGRILCVGSDTCKGECEGAACFAPDGPVSIWGDWAPENMSYHRAGFEPH